VDNLKLKEDAAQFAEASMQRVQRARWAISFAAIISILSFSAGQSQSVQRHLDPAPTFVGIRTWLNSQPLTLSALRGHVVLVDFWAYSCINCLRTLPFLIKWQTDYKDRGLQIIGVHAPEFKFEHDPHNVQAAIARFGINYPVALDNDMNTWNSFHNEYWPTEYLIDRDGRVVYKHVGEGNYDETENAIRKLLDAGPAVGAERRADLTKIGSPEMYFGLDRVADLASPEVPAAGVRSYSLPADLKLNRFALGGAWSLSAEHATLVTNGGEVLLHCRSGKVFMVAASASPVTLSVTVDGKAQPAVIVRESRLYTLFDSNNYGDHVVKISVPKAGFQAYTFTFG
jgi:thiol-disulfide isomerase/thioredoxin